jgi:hypothetical protein
MFKLWIPLLLSVLLVTPASGANAWSVWVYTPDTGRLRQINHTGTIQRDITLLLPGEADAGGFPGNVAISHSGTLIAYVLRMDADNAPVLLVWDVELSTFVDSFLMPPGSQVSLDFLTNPHIFSESDTQIAFSHYLMETGNWQVVVLDLVTDNVYAINASDPISLDTGLGAGSSLMPIVRLYRGADVYFTLLPVPGDAFSGPTYTWNTRTNALTASLAYDTFSADTLLMTGETIAISADDRFGLSSDPDAFPMVQFNTLNVYDPTIGLVPIYADAEMSFFWPRFIQNGERAAAYGQRADGAPLTLVLERSGTLVGSLGIEMSSLEGVFDGFVFTTSDPALVSDSTSTALFYTETRAGLPATPGELVWSSPPGERVTIVWTSDNFSVGPAEPVPWAMLAPPLIEPAVFPVLGAPPLPSPTPDFVFAPPTAVPPPGGIGPGVDALVNTTEGDRLRLRAGPGLSYSVVRELTDETRVTILEGPQAADGYVWWRVRLADGTSGWVVESADGLRTLLPAFGS